MVVELSFISLLFPLFDLHRKGEGGLSMYTMGWPHVEISSLGVSRTMRLVLEIDEDAKSADGIGR